MDNKEKNERYYFEKFLKACHIPNTYTYRECPDFVIHHDNRDIGVELRYFFIGDGQNISSEQRQSPIRERVTQKAQLLYEEKYGKGLEAYISFATIESEEGLAERIVGLIETITNEGKSKIWLGGKQEFPELQSVHINGPYTDASWKGGKVHNISNTSPEALQDIINEKEVLIDNYEKFGEMWLLIVIDFMNFGMDQEPLNVDYNNIQISKFDKVIIFKTVFDTVIELPRNDPSSF